jgi:hypothetical protein
LLISNPITLKRLYPILLFMLICLGLPDLHAQYKSEKDATIPLEHFYIERKGAGLRQLLSKLNFGLSTGYGRTSFKHELDGFGIVQQPDSIPLIFSSDPAVRYSNWVNGVASDPWGVAPGAFTVKGDTTRLGFKSKTFSVPLKATVHIEFDRYRIGGGYSYEFVHSGDFKPLTYVGNIGSFDSPVNNFWMRKYFAMLGGMVYRYYEYALVVDANIGGYKLGKKFDNAVIKKGIYFNLGVTGEREMSEYLRLFVRPSYEFKNYKLTLPEGGNSITHRMNGWYFNVGLTYRLPELRRCFLKECHAQINHAHGNREYRSRRHPFYKKQNPHHGENYPTLIKYKGKNKNKMNPY